MRAIKSIAIVLILILSFSCRNSIKQSENQPKTEEKEPDFSNTKVLKTAYVTAKSGLLYRTEPQGAVIDKFPYGSALEIIEFTGNKMEVEDEGKTISGEWVGVRLDTRKVYVFDGFLGDVSKIKQQENNHFRIELPEIKGITFDTISNTLLDSIRTTKIPSQIKKLCKKQNGEGCCEITETERMKLMELGISFTDSTITINRPNYAETIIDHKCDCDMEAIYCISDYYFSIDLLEITGWGYEWAGTSLYHLNSGHTVSGGAHSEKPMISPTGKYILNHSMFMETGIAENEMELYKINKDSISLLFSFQPEDWGPDDPQWINDSLLVFHAVKFDREDGKSITYKRPVIVKIKH